VVVLEPEVPVPVVPVPVVPVPVVPVPVVPVPVVPVPVPPVVPGVVVGEDVGLGPTSGWNGSRPAAMRTRGGVDVGDGCGFACGWVVKVAGGEASFVPFDTNRKNPMRATSITAPAMMRARRSRGESGILYLQQPVCEYGRAFGSQVAFHRFHP
jgi:hypothetical protein